MNIPLNQSSGLLPPEPSAEADDLSEFQFYLVRKNMADNTIRVYLYAIRQFFCLFSVLSPSNLQLYKLYLLEHYRVQTVNLRIRAVNCYLEFKEISGCRLPMVKSQQKNYLERIISEADYEYLKACLIRDGNLLYYFAVRYMAATGVRVSELVQIETGDICRGYKDLFSKGNKSRRIYIPSCLCRDTLRWINRECRPEGPVFLNRYGRPLSPSGIRRQLKNFACRYGMDPEVVYPHSFRHRFAKNFLKRFNDITLLADLLGHESIETTRIYLTKSSQEQRQIIDQIVTW